MFPSTTWAWRKVKISRAPQASEPDARKGGRWWYLPPWDRRRPLTLTIKYRGGAEGWVEVHARGSMGRFPGHTPILDLMDAIWR